jgi:hypothetical protein
LCTSPSSSSSPTTTPYSGGSKEKDGKVGVVVGHPLITSPPPQTTLDCANVESFFAKKRPKNLTRLYIVDIGVG